MPSSPETKIQRQIRSPRSAAIAGLIFSILTMIQMVMLSALSIENPTMITHEILIAWSSTVSFVVSSISFAGIALLWFTGVIRDWVGEREDRFFATIFLSSGIIYVAMLFIFAAIMGAIFSTYTMTEILDANNEIINIGLAMTNQIIGSYALRIAGVYMLSIGSLWLRAEHAPRWLIMLTFVIAISFVLFAGAFRGFRFLFPIWVFVVSVYILVLNYRDMIEE